MSPSRSEGGRTLSPDPGLPPEGLFVMPKSSVHLQVRERPARIAMWLNQNFLLSEELEATVDASAADSADKSHSPVSESTSLHVRFLSLREPGQFVVFDMTDGRIHIGCDKMDLCGDLVQALAEYLGLDDLGSTCDFPEECSKLEELLVSADELQSVRQRLSAEMADNSGVIRTLIVRAEDSRLMMDIKNMRKWYSQLYDLNRDLISGYKIRCNNHQELMETLKHVNQIIQRAGRLRVGKSKAKVISDCRGAIKGSNVNMLVKVIRTGEA